MYLRVMEKIKNSNIDGYLIASEANRNFLCSKGNYYLPGTLLVTKNEVFLVTPSRNINYFKKLYTEYTVLFGNLNIIIDLCKNKGLKRIGYESNITSKDEYDSLSSLLGTIELVEMPDFIEDIRMIKTQDEIEFIQEAVSLADKGFLEFLNYVKVGMTERQARNIFQDILLRLGADGFSFNTLLSSGERCFMPHCAPTDKIIQNGEFVLLDFGIILNGYCSDTSRTIIMGQADEKQKHMYELVLKAQIHALNNIKAGMTCAEADAFARDVINAEVKQGCFDYGLGHGIGMTVHEKPRLHPSSNYVLSENTIVSVEPGIYIEGWGGIRIEDLLVIGKESGGRNLTKCTKELLEIK